MIVPLDSPAIHPQKNDVDEHIQMSIHVGLPMSFPALPVCPLFSLLSESAYPKYAYLTSKRLWGHHLSR